VESVFGSAEVAARSKGFLVIEAVKAPREREDGPGYRLLLPDEGEPTGA
jgi:hypothetical protein